MIGRMTTSNDARLRLDSLAVHAGREDFQSLGVHATPIDLSSTYPLPSVAAGGDAYEVGAGGGDPSEVTAVYQRLWNPTVARFERAFAALERAEAAVAFATGMAAVTAVLTAAKQRRGSHVVAVRPLYGGTDHLLASGLLGTETTFVEHHDQVARAVRSDTGLVVAETPGNPTLELVDLDALVAAAGDAPVLIDNTFATPVLQRPLEHGAAFSMHSATEYIGGHGDVMGGVVACSDEWAQALRPVRAITGAIAHPFSAYLMHRGLQTLPLRVRAQQAGAQRVAEALAAMPGCTRCATPVSTDATRPASSARAGRWRAPARCSPSTSARTSGPPRSRRACGSSRTPSRSGASIRSSSTRRPSRTGRCKAEAKPNAGVLRVSIGLEDPEDLIDDLERAIAAAVA